MTTEIKDLETTDDEAMEESDESTEGDDFEEDLEFLEEFITEWNDHLEQSETALLALEENPSDMEALNSIFRAFHSIKGGAGFVNLTTLQKFAHRAENLLDRARNEEIKITGTHTARDDTTFMDFALRFTLTANSPDLTGNLVVDIADVAKFTQLWFSGYDYRIDFYWDGIINIADVALFVQGLGSACP